jgi:hypothetical protein
MSGCCQKTTAYLEKLKNDIPVVTKTIGLILLIVNIFLPGVGTMISACVGSGCKWEQIIVGICQSFTSFLIIGWIWSIWWGIVIVQKSSG